jgi:hypothetical protein
MAKANNTFAVFKLIHTALLVGQIIFTAVMAFLVFQLKNPIAAQLDKPLQVAAILIAAAGFFSGNAIFKKRLGFIQANTDWGLSQKFAAYRTASIIQWALLEAGTLFTVVCYFLVGNQSFLALAGMLIILFGLQMPSKAKLALQLYIHPDELKQL